MKRLAALLLCAALTLCICSCGSTGAVTRLGFSGASNINLLKSLDGKQVEITGYMATVSPVTGEFIYLMNLPYQSCPFCKPNTTELSNTIAVYAKKGSRFDFTDRAVKVTGKLEMGTYKDEFGYDYSYRIVDAKAQIVELKELSGDYAIWTQLSQNGIVSEVYSMFDFLHLVCQWSDYYLTITHENGETEQVNMWPGDLINLLNEPEPNGYATQNAPGYFSGLIERVNAVSAEKLRDLSDLLSECEQLKNEALQDIENERFVFNESTQGYRQTDYDELYEKWYDLYARYTVDFMERWEL
ncbi:MAG: hypothetical protein K5663_01810 [Clostridiales bacterium]|nr:hypothetical protein [Clostridiales bacterium]